MPQKVLTVLLATVFMLALGVQLGMSKAEDADLEDAEIMGKLDQILANQAQMFKQFDQIKEELAIIKIRASM